MLPPKPTIFLVAHGDHNFHKLNCVKEENRWKGHMDNQLGVYTVMQAYFSGQLPQNTVNIQITYGEQKTRKDENGNWVSFLGAREVMQEVDEDDLVIVIDVTSMPKQYQHNDFTIQKCKNQHLQSFFHSAFAGKYTYEIFQDTPDTEACQDQTDAFRQITQNVVFFGMMVYGGDYNCVPVYCNFESQKNSVNALIDLCQHFETSWQKFIDQKPKSPLKIANQKYYQTFESIKKLTLIKQKVYSEHQDPEDKWKCTSRKFIYSEQKRFLEIEVEESLSLKEFFQHIRSLSSVKDAVKNFETPQQSTIIISVKSTKLLKETELIDLSKWEEFVTEKYHFIQSDKSEPEIGFLLLTQKKVFKFGIVIVPTE